MTPWPKKKTGRVRISFNRDDSPFAFILVIVFAIVILAMLWAKFR